MFKSGLVSVSFRNLSVEEIIENCVENNLKGIEWGGDIHVPSGDAGTAKKVSELMDKAKLETFAYGSYYRVGVSENFKDEFEKVLNSAILLNAPLIRVWAYNKGSEEVTEEEFLKVVKESKFICEKAAQYNIKIAFECHNQTLTDDYEYALDLLKKIGNCKTLWQPNQFKNLDYNLESIKKLLPYITNIHTFNWEGNEKFSLENGVEIWGKYIDIFKTSGKQHNFLLEFMPDNNIKSLAKEAKILNEMLGLL